ncbi:MAG: hypothetical protein WC496_02640 [Phycisphaerae bacterium]|jgi:hypothetical protein
MATSFRLRNFSNPAILKAISRPLMMQFLQRHAEFFAGRHFNINACEELDYDHLASVLMSPNEDTPEELLDALFFIDEMSLPGYYDELMVKMSKADIVMETLPEPTVGDLAVAIWLASPSLLESIHAEQFMVRAKKFDSFLTTCSSIPSFALPGAATIQNLESDLNHWFETKKRGRGTKVFVFIRDGIAWFLVRHGEPYKREGTLKNDEPSSIFYRPEKFDVLLYNPEIGEFSIHTSTKGEKKAYCKFFGKHIFGNESMFDIENSGDKYSLDPLRVDGSDSLLCTDVDGIDEIKICELQFRHDANIYHIEIHKADDVFEALESQSRCIPAAASLVKASFKITFANSVRPRTVSIRPPNVAIFDRESDSLLVNTWLEKRGFITINKETIDGETNVVLAVA